MSGGENTQEDAVAQAAASATICIMWCAIALGGLVQGRSVASVSCETRPYFFSSTFASAMVVLNYQLAVSGELS